MDLAIVSGRGPDILTNIDGLKPYVRDENIVLFGYRDADQSSIYWSQDVRNSSINVFDLSDVKKVKNYHSRLFGYQKFAKEGSGYILDSSSR